MRYTLEMELPLLREKVVALFADPANFPEWQDSLVSYEPASGVPGQEGATAKMVHNFGSRRVEMKEIIESNNLPDELTVVYEAKGAWNRVVYRFVEKGPGETLWIFDTEFRCSGILRVMAFLMPGMFKKASLKDMRRFKNFVQSRSAAA